MFNRKGQAAMEFLMTYGWAILVVLIAIGALAYFGVLNPSRFLPESCTVGPGISCEAYKVTGESVAGNDGTIDLVLRNGLGESINTVTVNVDRNADSVGDCTADAAADGSATDIWNDGSILDDATPPVKIQLIGCDIGGSVSSGDRYKADLLVTYTGSGDLIRTKKGSITTKIE